MEGSFIIRMRREPTTHSPFLRFYSKSLISLLTISRLIISTPCPSIMIEIM